MEERERVMEFENNIFSLPNNELNVFQNEEFMKMELYRISIFLISIVCLYACSDKQQIQPKPAGLIPEEEMSSILAEMYLVESSTYTLPADSIRVQIAQGMYNCLLQKHGITMQQLNLSIHYYLGYKELSDRVLQKASEKLQAERDSLFGATPPPE